MGNDNVWWASTNNNFSLNFQPDRMSRVGVLRTDSCRGTIAKKVIALFMFLKNRQFHGLISFGVAGGRSWFLPNIKVGSLNCWKKLVRAGNCRVIAFPSPGKISILLVLPKFNVQSLTVARKDTVGATTVVKTGNKSLRKDLSNDVYKPKIAEVLPIQKNPRKNSLVKHR